MPRFVPGLAALLLLAGASLGHADFLILRNGETYRGKLEKVSGGRHVISGYRFSVGPEEVARASKEKSVEEVILNWGAEIEAETMRDPATARLWLARFCIFNRRYDDAHRFLRAWGKAAAWKVTKSKYYFILSNAKKKRVKEVKIRLDAVMEQFKKDFKIERKLEREFVVRMFRDQASFEAHARENGVTDAAAYYSPEDRELVLWDMSMTNKQLTFESIFHEANHQYMDEYYFKPGEPPPWLSEGLATYYESARFRRGKMVDVGRKHMTYLLDAKKALNAGRLRPLKEFLRLKSDRFSEGRKGEFDYAQAWALVYFLRQTKDKAWRGLFGTALGVVRKAGPAPRGEAMRLIMPIVEKQEELEKAYLKYLERL